VRGVKGDAAVRTRSSVLLVALLSAAAVSADSQHQPAAPSAPTRRPTLASPARAAEAGRPFIRLYTPKEYGAGEQNWAIAQDDRGVIYVGNNLGVLEYDGASWRLIRLPNLSVVRSFAIDDHGRIYAGAVGDFGYLAPGAGGRTTFVSLLSHVPAEDRAFGDVWRTLLTPEGVYFQSQQYLFRWSNGGIRVWKPKSRFYRAGVAHGVLYIGEPETGLMEMVGDSLQEVPGGRQFVDEPYPVILPYDGGKVLVGTHADGLFLVDGHSVTRFPTEVDAWLRTMDLYRGTELPDKTMALSTTGGGVAILDRQGRLRQIFDASTGLEQQAYYVTSDSQGALWLALDDGIARIETPSPISVFDRASGLKGAVSDILRHAGTLYVTTAKGVYYLSPSGPTSRPAGPRQTVAAFVPVEGVMPNVQSWWLLSVDDPTGRSPSQLLAATSAGVYRIDGHRAVAIRESVAGSFMAAVLCQSSRNPDRVFVGLFDGLASLRFDRGRWVFEGRVGGIGDEVRTIDEDTDGRLWLGTAANGVLRVTFWPPEGGASDGPLPLNPRVERFGAANGLPATGIMVSSIAGKPVFTSFDQIFRFDPAANRFTPDSTFKVVTVDPAGYGGHLWEDQRGDVWVCFGREWAVARRRPDGSYRVEKQPFLRFAGLQTVVNWVDADGVAWFGGRDGLVRYDPSVSKNYAVDFPTLIRRVVVNGTSVPAASPNAGAAPEFKSDRNALRFEFAAPSFDDESANEFQFYLEGLDKGWSDWNREANRDYTNLPPGHYRFHVRARNVYGHVGRAAVYGFTILPPWYRTWAAYGLDLILLGAGVFGVDRVQRRRLLRQERERARLREAQLRADAAEALARSEGERSQSVELLSEIGKEITASLDVETIFLRLYERVNQLADASVFGVGLYDVEKQQIDYHLAVEDGKRYVPYTRDMADKNQFPVWCIENRKPVFINEVATEYSRYLARYDDPRRPLEDGSVSRPTESLLYLPLIGQGRVLGVITIQSFRKHAYTEYHLNLLQNLAAYTSIALDNASAYRQLNEQAREIRQRAAELVTIDTISRALAADLELGNLIPLVGEQVRQIFGAQIAYVALYDQATGMIQFPYGYGDEFPSLPLGVGMSSRIIQTGEPLLINENISSRAAQLNIQRSGIAAKSYLGVPIPVGGQVIGVLSVQSIEEEGRFTEADLRLLTTIAANVGVAIHNARLFEEARLARAAAEEADAAKSAFLSTVSHELRTPLTSVLGFAKIIRKRLEDRIFPTVTTDDARLQQTIQQVGENLTVVVSEGERLTKLIDDVLDLAKIEAGKLEWHMDDVAIADVIDRATAATSSLFEQKGLPLVKDVAPGLPVVVGDADRLLQVVINLISNAVKFTAAGSVTCRARLQDDGVVVSVIDTGYGIAPADQPRIFEKFKQVGDALTDKPKGTGLGLPICREIVEHHGGRIWVESEPGRGSTFSFCVPVRPRTAAGHRPVALDVLVRQLREHAAGAALRTPGTRPNGLAVNDDPHISALLEQGRPSKRVLVIDEDATAVRMLSDVLHAGGYNVTGLDGSEPVARALATRPGIVLLNAALSEKQGLLQALRFEKGLENVLFLVYQ
jgi:signal transduction histidine kinase